MAEINKDNWWYILILPAAIIILLILSALGMSDTQFDQFKGVETEGVPAPTETTP